MARLFKTGITSEGDITAGNNLRSSYTAGDEGGQIFLNKPVTNTSITNGVNIDVYQNRLRIWEDGGTNRGVYIDMTAAGTGVGTNLLAGGGGSYTLPAATSTALGGIELFSDTAQTVAANAVTTTASRTYGIQLNASLQGVVNVPWDSGVTSVTGTSPISSSGGTTPAISIDQTSLYPGNIWTNPNDYTLDFSASAAFQSVLGSSTRAFTMSAGNTYEVELYMQVGQTFISNTTSTVGFQWRTTNSGSPTTNIAIFNSFSQSTVQTSTGSVTVARYAGVTGNVIVSAVNSTTPNRFAIVQSKGQIRIGGTGTVTISPSLQTNALTDNGVTVYKNLFFKITRIGSDTMTNLGTWTA